MKVVDAGHHYQLAVLDSDVPATESLLFVKREGPKYPGNVGRHHGTTVQEVLRAVVDRLAYVNRQEWSDETSDARDACMDAIYALEWRAAKRHGRKAPTPHEAVYGETCPKCNHVGCKGECH